MTEVARVTIVLHDESPPIDVREISPSGAELAFWEHGPAEAHEYEISAESSLDVRFSPEPA